MISKLALLLLTGSLLAQQTDWIAAGNRALDRGGPEEAAADFAQALEAHVTEGAPPEDLLHLRVSLATAYLEAGEYRAAEAVLQEAQKTAYQLTAISRAELLNAWSALHLKMARVSAAEAELQEARRIVLKLADPGDLLPTVLHNLAAVEMRTGRYAEALTHEQEALVQLEKSLPPDYAALIRAWASLASVQYMMGRAQEAQLSMERALASAEKTYGPSHAILADLLESDAVILDQLKRKKSAREARARARKIRGAGINPADDRLALTVKELASPMDQVHLRSVR